MNSWALLTTIDKHIQDSLTNILKVSLSVTWEPHDKTLPASAYEKVPYDPITDDQVMRVVGKEDTYTRVTQYQYLSDMLQRQRAMVARTDVPELWDNRPRLLDQLSPSRQAAQHLTQ